MHTVYLIIRWLTLISSTAALWIILWKGAHHWVVAPGKYNWPMAILGLWAFTSAYGTSEAIALDAKPGPRIFLGIVTAVCTLVFAVKTRGIPANTEEPHDSSS